MCCPVHCHWLPLAAIGCQSLGSHTMALILPPLLLYFCRNDSVTLAQARWWRREWDTAVAAHRPRLRCVRLCGQPEWALGRWGHSLASHSFSFGILQISIQRATCSKWTRPARCVADVGSWPALRPVPGRDSQGRYCHYILNISYYNIIPFVFLHKEL